MKNKILVFKVTAYIKFETKKKYYSHGVNFSHPGFAWACTRKIYERIGGIFIWSILGSGDHQMAQAFLRNIDSIRAESSAGYKQKIKEFVMRTNNLRVGYVPGMIKHYFHGLKENRRYNDRWKILVKYQYDPNIHVKIDENGLLVPSDECPPEMLKEIRDYFSERREDS
jgi:hypothetical protein